MTDTTFPVRATAAEAEHRAHLRRAIVASTVGTTIEWYDFLIYSTMTGLVFGKVFFSGSDPLIDTLKAFGVSLSVLSRDRSAPRSLAIMATASAARRP
jgi:hypothetical protein